MSAEVLRHAATQIREDCPIPEHGRELDFIDYPTGWALQHAGLAHADQRCSAAQTAGALLCDCESLPAAWRHWRALLATADWLERVANDWHIASHGYWSACAVAVAQAYLPGSPASAGSAGSTA